MLELNHIDKSFNIGTVNENHVLNDLNLKVNKGDFITVIGGNGAGKSTMLNLIAGVHIAEHGKVILDGVDVTYWNEVKRAKFLGRVFQDPMLGTAPSMLIEENLAMAARRTKRRGLRWGIHSAERQKYRETLASLELGLEDRMSVKVGSLSGGQRQAVTLLMATLEKPKILLLDEHTAALDPKTSAKVLALTEKIVSENQLTTMMVTHNMQDAIRYGNRLIMMQAGHVILDISGEEKKALTVDKLLKQFETVSGESFNNDRTLLSR